MRASTSSGTSTSTWETSRPRSPRRRTPATSTPGFCPRSRRRRERIAPARVARGARRTSFRSCSAATTRSRSERSAGLHEVHGPGGAIWIDAHGDLNSPETSPSGNVHGMVLAAALGLAGDRFRGEGWGLPALEPGRVALVGVRSLDEGERELLARARCEGVHDERRRSSRRRARDSRGARRTSPARASSM